MNTQGPCRRARQRWQDVLAFEKWSDVLNQDVELM